MPANRASAAPSRTVRDTRQIRSAISINAAPFFASRIAAVAIMAGFPHPVLLVLVASALALSISPIIFFLNLFYCLTIIPKNDKAFYPSRFTRWFAWSSLATFAGLTIVLLMVKVFGMPALGV